MLEVPSVAVRRWVRWWSLWVPEVELASAAICSDRSEDVDVWTERDVIDLFIMSYQLSENRALLDVPDRTSRVDRRRSDQGLILDVPVERGQWRRELAFLKIGLKCV